MMRQPVTKNVGLVLADALHEVFFFSFFQEKTEGKTSTWVTLEPNILDCVYITSAWRDKIKKCVLIVIPWVLYLSFLRAILLIPHLQLLEHFTQAFLQGQPRSLAVFLRLHEFLQGHFCDRNKLFAMENGCWWWNNLHFFNIYVHTYIVAYFLHFRRQSSQISCPLRTCQARGRNENNNCGAQGIVLGRDPSMQKEERMKVWLLRGDWLYSLPINVM